MSTTAIILASGSGSRFGGEIPKQFTSINGKLVYRHSVDAFVAHPSIDSIVVVVHPDHLLSTREALVGIVKPMLVVPGGDTRQESAYRGLHAVKSFSPQNVLIHDAARPNVSVQLINRVLAGLNIATAISPVTPVTDTLYEVTSKGLFVRTVGRENIRRVQTPQGFVFDKILTVHEKALKEDRSDFTDDVMLIDHYQAGEIVCVEGDPDNIKLTTPSDEKHLAALLRL
jgi:2-C-methyl-D-erythritol 4-phosphate cytidylyltransferase/2-C-methyl-D-erythritol 2,4-cyclodiphosphate synthase